MSFQKYTVAHREIIRTFAYEINEIHDNIFGCALLAITACSFFFPNFWFAKSLMCWNFGT